MIHLYKTTVDTQTEGYIADHLNDYLSSQEINTTDVISVQYKFYKDKNDFHYSGVKHCTDIWITVRDED
jgi:hypothetical protein